MTAERERSSSLAELFASLPPITDMKSAMTEYLRNSKCWRVREWTEHIDGEKIWQRSAIHHAGDHQPRPPSTTKPPQSGERLDAAPAPR